MKSIIKKNELNIALSLLAMLAALGYLALNPTLNKSPIEQTPKLKPTSMSEIKMETHEERLSLDDSTEVPSIRIPQENQIQKDMGQRRVVIPTIDDLEIQAGQMPKENNVINTTEDHISEEEKSRLNNPYRDLYENPEKTLQKIQEGRAYDPNNPYHQLMRDGFNRD